MKMFPFITVCWVQLTISHLLPLSLAQSAPNIPPQSVSTSVGMNELGGSVDGVSEIDKLWPENPKLYFQSMLTSAVVLGKSQENAEAKGALLCLFTNMMQKQVLTNMDNQADIFGMKSDAFSYFMNFESIKGDKLAWIAAGQVLGEIRTRIIPNYQNRGTAAPGYGILLREKVHSALELTNQVLRQQFEMLVKQNDEDFAMNTVQSALRRAENTLAFFTTSECARRFPSSNPLNREFIEKLIQVAHLTEAEQNAFK